VINSDVSAYYMYSTDNRINMDSSYRFT